MGPIPNNHANHLIRISRTMGAVIGCATATLGLSMTYVYQSVFEMKQSSPTKIENPYIYMGEQVLYMIAIPIAGAITGYGFATHINNLAIQVNNLFTQNRG